MTKELEALEVVAGYIPNKDTQLMENGMPFRIVELFLDEIDLIKKALIPPTKEEVCKELNEWLKKHHPNALSSVKFDYRTFWYLDDDNGHTDIIHKAIDGRLLFFVSFPPRLVALIGRFYENLEEKK
jgi:hypothetical protein